MEKGSVYEELYRKLSVTPTGVPRADKLLEILRILFTPEEARLALILPFMPTPLSDIADASEMGDTAFYKGSDGRHKQCC